MEQKQEPQRPKIGTEEVRRAADILRRYHAGKRQLEQRIIDNEQFWKLRHWQQMDKAGQGGNPADPQPTSGWLVNCILSKHADAMDCYPEPTVLPREPGDREEARKLTRILPVVLKKNGFKRTYSSAWWYKLKSGCAVYGVFWDAGKLNGLGDIAIRRMDLLNLFWEPGVTDIQDSPHFFSTELQDREALEERYPWAKGKADRGGWSVSRYLYDDAVDTSGKVLVVDWYYHTRENGRKVLQYCKFVGDTVLYATENDPDMREKGWYDHGKYPFVFDVLEQIQMGRILREGFFWPFDLVRSDEMQGYVLHPFSMDAYPSVRRFLPSSDTPRWTIAVHLFRRIGQLHREGLTLNGFGRDQVRVEYGTNQVYLVPGETISRVSQIGAAFRGDFLSVPQVVEQQLEKNGIVLDGRVRDIFSAAVIAFYLLFYTHPFIGEEYSHLMREQYLEYFQSRPVFLFDAGGHNGTGHHQFGAEITAQWWRAQPELRQLFSNFFAALCAGQIDENAPWNDTENWVRCLLEDAAVNDNDKSRTSYELELEKFHLV